MGKLEWRAMTDQKLLDNPANKLALTHLRALKEPISDEFYPLVLLALWGIDQEEDPQSYLADARDILYQLQTISPEQPLAMLVSNPEQLEEDLLENPERRAAVLEEHLQDLYNGLEGKSLEEVEARLLDNLACNLEQVFPSWEPARPPV
jgi:hypothetical protein